MKPRPVLASFSTSVQREPVRVMRHDRVVGVMVSAEDYEAMRSVLRRSVAPNTA
jgi:PHD/YefM family antitoxin component YafN of YafNO toxin-antitoxin module